MFERWGNWGQTGETVELAVSKELSPKEHEVCGKNVHANFCSQIDSRR
jgi:hypothetical protein